MEGGGGVILFFVILEKPIIVPHRIVNGSEIHTANMNLNT